MPCGCDVGVLEDAAGPRDSHESRGPERGMGREITVVYDALQWAAASQWAAAWQWAITV